MPDAPRARRPRSGRPPRAGVLKKAFYKELIAAAEAVTRSPAGRTAEDNLFRVAAEVERFVSEWIVRALADDSRVLSQRVQKEAMRHAQTALGQWDGSKRYGVPVLAPDAIRISSATFPAQPTLEESRRLLGGHRNVTFENAADLRKRVERDLAYKYVARFRNVTPEELAVIDAVRAIRDAIAHGSPQALARLNETVRSTHLQTALRWTSNRQLRRGGIGQYLCDRGRFKVFLGVLVSIIRKLDISVGRPPDKLRDLGLVGP